jgi:hypothetical protein
MRIFAWHSLAKSADGGIHAGEPWMDGEQGIQG